MKVEKEEALKSKIEFVLEYLDHHKRVFNFNIFIYPNDNQTNNLKKHIEKTFQSQIEYLENIDEVLNCSGFVIYNSDSKDELKILLNDGRYSFSNSLITSDVLIRGYRALVKVLDDKKLTSVLDIGCGDGIQGRIFSDNGKIVTGINLGSKDESFNGEYLKKYGEVIIGDYLRLELNEKYDIIWLSHILEHIHDVGEFLIKVRHDVKEGGTLAIIVPPDETDITINHEHTFNTGRILRFLILAGFDCRDIISFDYGYNKCFILNNVKFHSKKDTYLKDEVEIKEAFKYLPACIQVNTLEDGNLIFSGDIKKINC